VDEEFGQFVAACGRALCRTAYLLTGDWQAGEDLVQETLTRTYLRRRRLRSQAALEPYARRVLVSLFLSSRRRHWHRELPFADVPEQAAGDEFAAVEQRRAAGRGGFRAWPSPAHDRRDRPRRVGRHRPRDLRLHPARD